MLKYLFFVLLSFNLFALEISISSGKENFEKYSILHIENQDNFLCQELRDDLDKITQIVCAFEKQPSQKFKTEQNDFFKIESTIKNKTFFLLITPYKKLKLFPIIFDLTKDSTTFVADVKLSKRWMVVGYNKKLPFLKKQVKTSSMINFPYFQESAKFPYVGGLDIKGNPVHIKKVKDVSDYLKIKKYYKEKDYEKSLELIDDIIQGYPNSLFMAELLLYKIKVYDKTKHYDSLIDTAKLFLKEYSSDENIPEVLALLANAYAKIGISSDADYFFDRLFSEHPDSEYALWGYIYKARMLEANGLLKKALGYYEKALAETANLEIAATAAYSLVEYYMITQKPKKAAKYAMKIIKAKPSYFMQDYKESIKIMNYFADNGDYKSASALVSVVLENIDDRDDEYEELLKNKALWLSKTQNKQEALKAINEYLKKFPEGIYEIEVKTLKDELFFDLNDANFTTLLQNYDELIEKYPDDSIGNKALYEKAKLLLKNGEFEQVLELKDALLSLDNEKYPESGALIQEAAIGAMQKALKLQECQKVLNIADDYNVTLSKKWDDGVYGCAMMGANFTLAKSVAQKNLKSKNMDERKKWLYRYIKVDFRTGNYSEVVDASKDLISLIELDKSHEYLDIYRILFDTYQRVENSDGMIQTIQKIEEIFGVTFDDIERYVAMISVGIENKDDNMVIEYASKVMQLQESASSYIQSPYVEFSAYQAYLDKENYNEALAVMKSLDKVDLTPAQRARQKYIMGTLYEKLWRDEEAKKAYEEAIKADSTSPWAKLAEDAKDI